MSFDRLAPHYSWMEVLFAGGLMQRSRTAFLAHATHCQHALVVGEGPGTFLAKLLEHSPNLHVTCVEQSARMIAQAQSLLRRRHLDHQRVDFVQQDALAWSPPQAAFDLVITHFFLDCFQAGELDRMIPRLADGATPRALWLLSDFQVPPAGWRRWRAECIVSCLYVLFRFTAGLKACRLASPERSLRAAGFCLVERRKWSLGLVHSDLWRRQQVIHSPRGGEL